MELNNNYELRKHGIRVGCFSQELASWIGLSENECKIAFLSGDLHDIGKLYIDENVLYKREPLTKKEFNYIKSHVTSYGLFFKYNNMQHDSILNAIRHHHENYDGTGYPDKLVGNDIPVLSRIIRICDCYDSLTSERVYRSSIYTQPEAIQQMLKDSRQFDKAILKAFIQLLTKSSRLMYRDIGGLYNSKMLLTTTS